MPTSISSRGRPLVALGSSIALALALGACGTSSNSSSSSSNSGGSGSSGGAKSGAIGLLLPESKTTRYEAFDHPLFAAKLKELCPKCSLKYANANQDAAQQQSQADSLLTQGVKVLVLDPVDSKAAQAITNKAKAQGVPVVSYDRLADGPVNYYVSYDNVRVGKLQGQSLLQALGPKAKSGKIIWINGAPTDPNAAQFKQGAHSVLNGKVNVGKEFDTPDWSPDKAQTEAQQAITSVGKGNIVGIYSANDGMAAGIAAAVQDAGISPVPPLTGQDAQIDGIQRIVAGQQYMTVYKAIKPEADAAAEMAVDLLQGKSYDKATATAKNSVGSVKAQLFTPVAVTQKNIRSTVVKDGFYKVSQICTGQYAKACKKIGLQ